MIEIKIIASGSKGNCYVIQDGDHRIMIDPGIPIKEIRRKCKFNLAALDFCLLSHEHNDHSKAVKDMLRLGVACLTSPGTANELGVTSGIIPVKSQVPVKRGSWAVLPFDTQHDAAEPLGFLIQTPSGKNVCFATDTCYIRYRFTGVTHYMVECNYSETLLQKNEGLAEPVKTRIRQSHFELENVKDFFRRADLSKTESIYLIHLSDDNSDEDLFVKEIEAITGKPVYASL